VSVGRLKVREVFPTVQGEGSQTGKPAVFIRFSGCNLWSGLEASRESGRGECAQWCDTDFASGVFLTPDEIVAKVNELRDGWNHCMVVMSGGEPLLQLRKAAGVELCKALKGEGVWLAIETNGTIDDPVLELFDHITVSPKSDVSTKDEKVSWDHIKLRHGTDLKIIVPTMWSDDAIDEFCKDRWGFPHKFFQPKDIDGKGLSNINAAIEMTKKHAGWRVSFQTHKYARLP